MALSSITAHFTCDACNEKFKVYLDPAAKTTEYLPSVLDLAEEEVRSYLDLSIQHDMHLCDSCTRKADAIGEDEYQPTREEILSAVGAI